MFMYISSKNNDIIRYVRKISSKSRFRRDEGLFFAEGRRLISETPPEKLERVFVSESFSYGDTEADRKLKAILDSFQEVYEVSDAVFDGISETSHGQGVAALIRQPSYRTEDLLSDQPFLLVLENVQDPGNLGTMMRTALGAGVSGVVMTRDCVDIFSPKTVRATMGAIFRVPFLIVDDAAEAKRLYGSRAVFYATSPGGERSYETFDYTGGSAFVVGNEGNGLRADTIGLCDEEMFIPMEGGLESLNAAMAAGILMYEASRQRRQRE